MDELTAQKKTQELYSSVNNLLKTQNLEIKKLSEKLNVKEDVIRNIMKEERPVANKRKPLTAFDMYCAQRRIDGADENEDIDVWLKLSKCDKLTFNQMANNFNNEQTYETVQYIDDKNEREHTLKQSIKELNNLCREISQGCGYHFLVFGIGSNNDNSVVFGTGTLKKFCSERESTIKHIKTNLIDYNAKQKFIDQEQMSGDGGGDDDNNNDDDDDDEVTNDQKLSEQKQDYNSNSHGFNFNEMSSFTISETYNANGFNKKRRDVMEDDEDFKTLVAKNVYDVNLESTSIRTEVYKFLEDKFQQDTKLKMSVPYEDWDKQESFVVSGWPRNIDFKEWDTLTTNEKKKVFMSLSRLQFHVRLDSNLSRERRASKKKRFV
ncbi:hypothetical protein C1645_755813 [Glomus cerebriforme]|uniref:Uncharacterized protein n=1 Tax=Glomus cerebriforme TaxID=658196 RepID=A0A397TI45_9GLOM|nr:hypothetical protein C1645_755813 [Glomus cerebriforme]